MAVTVSPMLHIEIVVRDAEEAYQFLHKVFNAEKIEEDFANFLDGPLVKVVHVGLGQVVLQFIQPIAEGGSWYEQLKEKGPGVHNLTFLLDNVEEAVKELEKEGVTTLLSFPLDWAQLLGPENTRPDQPPVYMMNSMEKIGFHLELAEAPWLKEPKTPLIYPSYTQPRPATKEKVSPMVHIEIVVRDAEEAYQFLHRVFGAEKVEEEFAKFLDSPFAKVIHVGLGQVVLQFIQPIAEEGSWFEQLKEKGPGVHNLTYVVDDMEETMKALESGGAQDLFTFSLDWGKVLGPENVRPDIPPVHMVNTMEKLGFHLELSELPTDQELGTLQREVG